MLDKLPSFSATGAALPVLDGSTGQAKAHYATSLAPALVAPASDGSLKGLGEKFEANPSNGTCRFTVPFKATPGRNGFTPSISLTYDSGAGNGYFGLGWSLGIESVSRSTSHRVPRYIDGDCVADEDVFILSGEENLVPVDAKPNRVGGYTVQLYRPRVVQALHCIERWTSTMDPADVHWRTVSPDNVTSIYGDTDESRIQDPQYRLGVKRIFSWLLSAKYDCYGNAVQFLYRAEDSAGEESSAISRLPAGQIDYSANKCLTSIRYGNKWPNRDLKMWQPIELSTYSRLDWLFEIVLDYGDHSDYGALPDTKAVWPLRKDGFSSYRSGFEIRTNRLCRKIAMFHHMKEELGVDDCLVSSLRFTYDENPFATMLSAVTHTGYAGSIDESGHMSYDSKSLPATRMFYAGRRPLAEAAVEVVPSNTLHELSGIIGKSSTVWIDLYKEGLTGLLSTESNTLHYARNSSTLANRLAFDPPNPLNVRPNVDFANEAPSATLLDYLSNGTMSALSSVEETQGTFERCSDTEWKPFSPFRSQPDFATSIAGALRIDLTGNGIADVLLAVGDRFVAFFGDQDEGFKSESVAVSSSVISPAKAFADGFDSVYIADMTGDGLADIVKVSNHSITYWPNHGHGNFGSMIVMGNSPSLDSSSELTRRRVQLADIDGSGTTDLIYITASGTCHVYWNQAGNSWSSAEIIVCVPHFDQMLSSLSVVDLLNSGTSCLVWTTELSSSLVNYIDLASGVKPRLLQRCSNGMGGENIFEYRTSTSFYIADGERGEPWITKLPFPVHCLVKHSQVDHIRRHKYDRTYNYHHGYWDTEEREFRGFGMVEQWDEDRQSNLLQPVVHTKTWFHTGAEAFMHHGHDAEYFQPPEGRLKRQLHNVATRSSLRPGVERSFEEYRQATRALKGSVLRTEIYADDGSPLTHIPYHIEHFSYTIRELQSSNLIQPLQRPGIYAALQGETFAFNLERSVDEFKLSQSLVLQRNDFLQPTESAAVSYGKFTISGNDLPQQGDTKILYSQIEYTNEISRVQSSHQHYRIPSESGSRSFELSSPDSKDLLSMDALRTLLDSNPSKLTLLSSSKTMYRADDLSRTLAPNGLESLGIVSQSYVLAFDKNMLVQLTEEAFEVGAFRGKETMTDILISHGGYVTLNSGDGSLWVPSGRRLYAVDAELNAARASYFTPTIFFDPFGSRVKVAFDRYSLLPIQSTDAVQNILTISYDYRCMAPSIFIDANDNRQLFAYDELGMCCARALQGKPTENVGDSLNGTKTTAADDLCKAFLQSPSDDLVASILGDATSCTIIGFLPTTADGYTPPVTISLQRDTHVHETSARKTRISKAISYLDGLGSIVQTKTFVSNNAWLASSWTVLNSKGSPARIYEPFYDTTHLQTSPIAKNITVCTKLLYDPLGREVGKLWPDKTYSKLVISPWLQRSFDRGDTISPVSPEDDPDIGPCFRVLDKNDYSPPWMATAQPAQIQQSQVYSNTPVVTLFDAVGHPISVTQDNGTSGKYTTEYLSQINGFCEKVWNSKKSLAAQRRANLLGDIIVAATIDAGRRWQLHDVMGQPLLLWDSRGTLRTTSYDLLRRPIASYVRERFKPEVRTRFNLYGEVLGEQAKANNLLLKLHKAFDQAGCNTNHFFDFKGNILSSSQSFATKYKGVIDWTDENVADRSALQPISYGSDKQYDALNQLLMDKCATFSKRFEYDLCGRTASISSGDGDAITVHASSIEYNSRGQRTSVSFGNGMSFKTQYDSQTFRKSRVQYLNKKLNKCVQDRSYIYDSIGHAISTEDCAETPSIFAGSTVRPKSTFTYDAVGRVTTATGREYFDRSDANLPGSRSHGLLPTTGPTNQQNIASYTESYTYDSEGNIVQLKHETGAASSGSCWTRRYVYSEQSGLESKVVGNRLSFTQVGSLIESYTYNSNGSLTGLPGFSLLDWTHEELLAASATQNVISGLPETTYYRYDGTGKRVRKVTERGTSRGQQGAALRETLYIAGYDIYRKYQGDGITSKLEKWTANVENDEETFARVEHPSIQNGEQVKCPILTRYQVQDLLGSVIIELDDQALVISHEEFAPFGSTTYFVTDSKITTSKAYRYANKERDVETGLDYVGRRYLATWLGRWTSADPTGCPDGMNGYTYCANDPVNLSDPTGLTPFMHPAVAAHLEYTARISEFRAWQEQAVSSMALKREGMYKAHVDQVKTTSPTANSSTDKLSDVYKSTENSSQPESIEDSVNFEKPTGEERTSEPGEESPEIPEDTKSGSHVDTPVEEVKAPLIDPNTAEAFGKQQDLTSPDGANDKGKIVTGEKELALGKEKIKGKEQKAVEYLVKSVGLAALFGANAQAFAKTGKTVFSTWKVASSLPLGGQAIKLLKDAGRAPGIGKTTLKTTIALWVVEAAASVAADTWDKMRSGNLARDKSHPHGPGK